MLLSSLIGVNVVIAVDCSELAIANAIRAWPEARVQWEKRDITKMPLPSCNFDIIIAYGLFHCLSSEKTLSRTVARLQAATKPGGYHVVCAFNDRNQDLRAHPHFSPLLLSHHKYLKLYGNWKTFEISDSDLHEVHL